MISFLLDTLLATGALIALVLVLRRPVARAFGPQCAYALWLLPLLRFAMPPIWLPASFAPVEAAPVPVLAAPPPEAVVPMVAQVPSTEFVAVAEPSTAFSIPWPALLLAVWLGGALLFIVWRFVTYRRMRRDLLAEARPVGEVGKVRLVETPVVSAPVAFGLIDKVVALPLFFMALEDRAARDFAIAHELAHHRGRDLAANILAQPILALHWFNPLAWLAWRAMRRDQEAACDARVLAARDRAERARYAEVIASFAAGPRLALAAPMACPMLGEKSIIHRLRSLKMDDISRQRRLLGRALVVAGGLALPMTATVTYAASELPALPEASEAPEAPEAAEAPEAPAAPAAPEALAPGTEVRTFVLKREGPDGKPVVRRFTLRSDGDAPMPAMPNFVFHGWGNPDDPEFQKKMEEWGKQMEKWGEKFDKDYAERAQARAQAAPQVPVVVQNCNGDPQQIVTRSTADDGRQMVIVCEKVAVRRSLSGLRRARDTIANNPQMDPEVRDEVIEELDQEIERIESDADSG